jgi:hypothetical protein
MVRACVAKEFVEWRMCPRERHKHPCSSTDQPLIQCSEAAQQLTMISGQLYSGNTLEEDDGPQSFFLA